MEKIELTDNKQYLIKFDRPNSVRHERWTVGVYCEEYKCFNLNPTIQFSEISECIDIDDI